MAVDYTFTHRSLLSTSSQYETVINQISRLSVCLPLTAIINFQLLVVIIELMSHSLLYCVCGWHSYPLYFSLKTRFSVRMPLPTVTGLSTFSEALFLWKHHFATIYYITFSDVIHINLYSQSILVTLHTVCETVTCVTTVCSCM